MLMGYSIATSTDPVAAMAWLVFFAVDFPVSVGLVVLNTEVDGNEIISRRDSSGSYSTLRDIDNFWLPALYFASIGSAWWYFVGGWASKALGKVRETIGT